MDARGRQASKIPKIFNRKGVHTVIGDCLICAHPKVAEIEQALLGGMPVEKVAAQYEVSVDELKMHACFHVAGIGADVMGESTQDSLTRKMKLREADMLSTVSKEYLSTLRIMGRRIGKLAEVDRTDLEDEDKQLKLAKLLTKPMVDLYIGLGTEIRQTVKTMAELDRMLNGPQDSLGSGLSALAEAIRNSDG